MFRASAPKIKFDFENYLEYLRNQVKMADQDEEFTIYFNTTMDTELLKKKHYDAVIFSNGSVDINPLFKGKDKITCVQAVDALVNPNLIERCTKYCCSRRWNRRL